MLTLHTNIRSQQQTPAAQYGSISWQLTLITWVIDHRKFTDDDLNHRSKHVVQEIYVYIKQDTYQYLFLSSLEDISALLLP
jgi:hypothetical protein